MGAKVDASQDVAADGQGEEGDGVGQVKLVLHLVCFIQYNSLKKLEGAKD
jgi:hypothetical protein